MSAETVKKKVAKKKSTTKKTVKKSTTRTMTAKKTIRKAPTSIARSAAERRRSNKLLFIALGIFFLIILTSVLIGLTDKGVIAVSQTINEKKANATPEELEDIETAERQRGNLKPMGGLTPIGESTRPKRQATQSSTTTATSTASSTEEADLESDSVTDEGTSSSTEDSQPDEAVTE